MCLLLYIFDKGLNRPVIEDINVSVMFLHA